MSKRSRDMKTPRLNTFYDPVEISVGGPIEIPIGTNVGDEFNVTGRARLIANTEEVICTSGYSESNSTLGGLRSYHILIKHLEPID